MEKKVVLVTGCSSGIGKEICNQLIKDGGFIVYGISRNEFEMEGLTQFKVDVTDRQGIERVIKKIIDREKSIDILISNAGMGISGPVETAKIEDVQKLLNVNFFGMVNCVQAVLPYMRERKSGKIIMTSSLGSKVGLPFQSFYSASKSALDSLGFALNLEVKRFGIQCLNILPGDTRTGFTGARVKQDDESAGIYSEVMERCVGKMEKDERNGMKVEKVAKVYVKYCKKKKIPLQKVVGFKNKVLAFLIKILPIKLANAVVRKMYAK